MFLRVYSMYSMIWHRDENERVVSARHHIPNGVLQLVVSFILLPNEVKTIKGCQVYNKFPKLVDLLCISRYTSQFENSSLPSDPKFLCSASPGLSRRQRQICSRDPGTVMSIAAGVRKGIHECQFQFQYQRWNCTTFPNDFSLFGKVLVKGTDNWGTVRRHPYNT